MYYRSNHNPASTHHIQIPWHTETGINQQIINNIALQLLARCRTVRMLRKPLPSYQMLMLSNEVLKMLELLIDIVGLVANLQVVAVMVTSPTMLKYRTNLYITSQSCLDALVAK